MKKMKLSVKLIGSFCLVSLMLLVGGFIGVSNDGLVDIGLGKFFRFYFVLLAGP